SEVTPLIGLKAKEIWDTAGLPEDLFQVVTGYGPTGAALIDSGIQLLVFTGSVATGRRVAAACGERLIPCVMELGGKAPVIACADADVERTARSTTRSSTGSWSSPGSYDRAIPPSRRSTSARSSSPSRSRSPRSTSPM